MQLQIVLHFIKLHAMQNNLNSDFKFLAELTEKRSKLSQHWLRFLQKDLLIDDQNQIIIAFSLLFVVRLSLDTRCTARVERQLKKQM